MKKSLAIVSLIAVVFVVVAVVREQQKRIDVLVQTAELTRIQQQEELDKVQKELSVVRSSARHYQDRMSFYIERSVHAEARLEHLVEDSVYELKTSHKVGLQLGAVIGRISAPVLMPIVGIAKVCHAISVIPIADARRIVADQILAGELSKHKFSWDKLGCEFDQNCGPVIAKVTPTFLKCVGMYDSLKMRTVQLVGMIVRR